MNLISILQNIKGMKGIIHGFLLKNIFPFHEVSYQKIILILHIHCIPSQKNKLSKDHLNITYTLHTLSKK